MKNILYRLLLLPLLLAAWGAQAQAPAWLNVYGVPTTSSVFGTATNAAGDIFVTGTFSGSATFGGTTLSSAGDDDVFVAKWNSTSNSWAWAVRGGGSAADQGNGIAVNGTNVYVTGYFNSNGGATFGNVSTTFNGAGGQDIFVAKFVDGGTSVTTASVVSAGGGSGDQGRAIAVNGSNVYITGYVTGAASFGGTALTPVYTTFDMYVAKYVDSGTLTYNSAVRAGGASVDRGNSIAVNGTNIYVAGDFRSLTAAFGSTTITNSNTDSNNLSYDAFVAKFTDSGTLAHATAVKAGGNSANGGNSPLDFGNGIAVSGTSVYLTGAFFSSSISFGNGLTLTNSDNTSTNSDMYLAKYTDSGTLTAVAATKNNTNSSVDVGSAVAVTGSTVYVAGNYVGSATYGSSTLTSNGGQDVFVAKFTDAGNSFTTVGAVSGGGSGDESANGLAISGTQVIAGGFLNPAQSATFVTNSGTTTIPAGNGGFIARVGVAATLPTVTTTAAASIASTSAVLGGNVTADGNATVTDRGVVYSTTNQTPTTSDTKDANGTDTGTFSETITGLTVSTAYYVRAYATNSAGTSYGAVVSFTTAAPVSGTTVVTNVSCNGGSNGTINLTPRGGLAPYTFVWNNGTTTEDRTGLSAGTYSVTITDATGATGAVNNIVVGQPLAITASTSQISIACNGGSTGAASISPAGGTSPYTYRWSTGATTQAITGLSAGTYSVVVTDANGCTITRSFNITQPSALTATTSQTDVTTNGGNNGSATITVGGGTPSYTYAWSPNVSTTATASNLSAGTYAVTATDANGCTIARSFTITQPAFAATAQPVTVQLDAFGNGTLNASSVNNGSIGSGSLTYTIQKIAFGYLPEGTTPLTLTTPNGANFTQIRFASYGTPTNSSTGNYSLGACNAANSLAAAQNAYVGRSSGSLYASNTDTRNNPVLGDPCGGTPKALAVQAGYSADATSLTYDCTEAGKTQYVLLTVTNGTSTSTSVAQVTVNAPPTATISSVSPTSAQRGATVTVAGTNLSGVSSVTVNGAAATVSNLTANSFTFVVPATATFGPGSISIATPCAQTLTNTFTVTAPALTATVSTTSASPTSTAPIPFSVTFSQSVGTTFIASDVTVTGGAVTSGSFSGSGAGPYNFSVTPSGTGTVTVSLAASVANDVNNTGNSASNSVSVQFQAPTIVVGPASLPIGTQGTAYSQVLSASGGTAPYTYALTAGALPAGLSLTNGTITGTATVNGTFNFTVTATDASTAPGPYSGPRSYSLVINAQPATAAPVVTTPANNSFSNNRSVTVAGTAPANSTVSILINGNLAGTTPASGAGAFSYLIPGNAPDGTYAVSATAQSSGATVSPSSSGNTFTIDGTAPTAALSSATVTSGGTTSTSPVSFTATFNEPVMNFTTAGLTVTNGTVTSGPTAGSDNTYTFQVTPSAAGTVTVQVAAGAARDRATNNNTASAQYAFTFAAPAITVAPASLPIGQQGTAYSQVLSASGGTAPYTYALTAGALPAGLSLTNGTITGTATVNGTFNFTVTATDASAAPGPYSGSQTYTLVIAAPAITATSWTGAVSTDWYTAGNWTQGVPDATIDATIPTTPSGGRFPAVAAGTASARNLTFNSGATLNQSGGTIALAANLTNNGTFLPTGGTVLLGNITTSSLLGSSNTRFWNLTVAANGAQTSTSASTSVQRVLTLNGSFATNGNPLTLESNSNGTAMLVNNGSNVVSGNVTVQRYISPALNANLGYRHFSSPISTGTVASLATARFTPVVNPDYNTVAIPGQVRPFPTVFGYDQSRLATVTNSLPSFDKGWFSPSAMSNALNVGQGYAVNLAAEQTFGLTGPQNNGNVVLNLARNSGATAADAGLALVGNPYPSPLNWQQVADTDRPGLDGVIYVFQSNDPSNPYAGSYGFYNNNIGTISPVLPLGQGFFVRVSQGQTAATLTLKNSHRPTAYANTAYQRTTAETRPLVHLTLKGTGTTLSDDAFVYFEQGSTESFDPHYDAIKIPNTNGLNLSTSVTGQQFSIDGRPELGSGQRVVPLAVGVPAPGSYTLASAELLNLATTPVYLRDVQLGTLTDLRLTPNYQFTVTNSSALITGRFELVFSPQQVLATTPAALTQQIALYPNPAKKAAFVELPASLGRQAITAALVDALGRQVRIITLPAQGTLAHQLDLSGLTTGVYALRLSTNAGVVVKRLVIE